MYFGNSLLVWRKEKRQTWAPQTPCAMRLLISRGKTVHCTVLRSPRSSSLAHRSGDYICNAAYKKCKAHSIRCGLPLFEIRQLPILPSGGPLSTFGDVELNGVFCRFPSSGTFGRASRLALARNGRWILYAIVTGMAPLVGLGAI